MALPRCGPWSNTASLTSERAVAAWTAVVINYNAGEHLAACVESISADDSAPPEHIIVIDNGSTDDSLARIATTQARIVHAARNLGYARAANLGISVSTTPIVAVLNADLVFAHGLAQAMVTALESDPSVGVVGPRITTVDGTDYPSARKVPSFATSVGHFTLGAIRPHNRWSREYRQMDADPAAERDVDWLSGAAMWFRREALDSVGGWDERFFMFLEDVDICVRLRKCGWAIGYRPSGSVVHVEGVSRRSRPYRSTIAHHRSAYRFAAIHWRGTRRLSLPVVAVALTLRAAVLCLVGWFGSRPRSLRAIR